MENGQKYEVEESALGRIVITEDQIDLIKKTVAIGATNDELKLFFYECRRRGVHPLDRMIHFVKRGKDEKARATFQAGIDFLRGQAEETGEYRGQEEPKFGSLKKGTQYPEWASVSVKRRDPETGEIYSVTALAYWDEYYPGETIGFMWHKMPRSQLAKCAEALALRKAFPKKIAGLYSFDEMQQADMIDTGHRPIQEPQKIDTQKVTTQIINVTQKDGIKLDGKTPYTLYTIIGNFGGDHKGFKTFDKKIADRALKAKGTSQLFEIEHGISKFGNDIVSMTEPSDENAQT